MDLRRKIVTLFGTSVWNVCKDRRGLACLIEFLSCGLRLGLSSPTAPKSGLRLQDMDHFRKFFGLPATERFLLVLAVTLLAAIRIALWLLPFKILQRISAKTARTCAALHKQSQFSTERGVWAIQVASRYVPHATCLTQALAAQALLGFGGIPSSIRIGVAKETAGSFEAHAWLESGGKILMGGAEADQRYTPLLSFSAWER